MTWEELREEYGRERIGPLIYGEVMGISASVSSHYDPTIYSGQSSWSDARDDLAQEVVTRVLLEEGQLDYLMLVCQSVDDFRALLNRQVRRLLARRRQRTVIDNLLDRCEPILSAESYERLDETGRRMRYGLRGREVELRDPTDTELREAALRVAVVPRVKFRPGERAPVVYGPAQLATAVRAAAEALPTSLTLSDLDRIFRLVLTDWLPSFLEDTEEEPSFGGQELSAEEVALVNDTTNRILASCSLDQQHLLLRKLEGVADGDIAREVGVSRPTLANRKDEVWRLMEGELSDLPDTLQQTVVSELSLRLAEGAVTSA
jgi:DNA-directed RNA polymerase specialized sigma24 family protein